MALSWRAVSVAVTNREGNNNNKNEKDFSDWHVRMDVLRSTH